MHLMFLHSSNVRAAHTVNMLGYVILLQYFVLRLHSQTGICFHLKHIFYLIFIRIWRHISNRPPVCALKSFFFLSLVFKKYSRSMKCRPRSHQHAVQLSNDPVTLLDTASPDGTCSCVGPAFLFFCS